MPVQILSAETTRELKKNANSSLSNPETGKSRPPGSEIGDHDPEAAEMAINNTAAAKARGRTGNLDYIEERTRKEFAQNKANAADDYNNPINLTTDRAKLFQEWEKKDPIPKKQEAIQPEEQYFQDDSEDEFPNFETPENRDTVNTRVSTNEEVNEDDVNMVNLEDNNNYTDVLAQKQSEVRNGVIGKVPQTRNGVIGQQITEVQDNDWRVKLTLPPGATYLYKTPGDPGILAPLIPTDGLIFPYTPQIQVQYEAEYNSYDLIHNNYSGHFYKGSSIKNILITGTFTAQDTNEANYVLACLHFLRSSTKMFYGRDAERGSPPPVLLLRGLGEYQFNNHKCVLTNMSYNLANDIDYIAAGVPDSAPFANGFVTALSSESGHVSWSSKISRLFGAGIDVTKSPTGNATTTSASNPPGRSETYTKKTYVPTKIDVSLTLLPVHTREEVTNEFSLRDYANGKLLKGGFW